MKTTVSLTNGKTFNLDSSREEFIRLMEHSNNSNELYHGEGYSFKLNQVVSIEDITSKTTRLQTKPRGL